MRDANIERLLGGYATNTLTDTERNALFEAALADQELFNALQDEETLRDLLEHVESRRAIERALQHPAPRQPSPQPIRAWLMPIWAWGLAGSAVATAALIFAVLMPRPPHNEKLEVAVSKPAAVQRLEDAVQEKALRVDAVRENAGSAVRRKSVAPLAPAIPKSVPPASEPAQTDQRPATPPPQIANPESQLVSALAEQRQADVQAAAQVAAAPGQTSFRAASAGYMAASASNVSISSIPYSLVKRGADGSLVRIMQGEELKAGDSVQLMLHPPVSGSLIMQEQIPGGNWRTIFPAASAVLRVTAQQDVVIPDAPIHVNGPQQLRLVLTPVPLPAALALSRAAKLAVNQDKQRLESNPAPSETQGLQRVLVTNLILAPGKVSPGASTNK